MDVKGPVSGALSASPADSDSSPVIWKRAPLSERFQHFLRVWMIKTIVFIALRLSRIFQAQTFRATLPTYTKHYAVRPMLESRVFLPKNYVSGTKLPLYIDIHGGGFILLDPTIDDRFCHYFANKFGYCVISIDYRKAPLSPFPIPVDDCAELARAVLADHDLPVDHDKVVIGGFSAGGNLALAVAQFKDLRPRFKGVIPVYPVTDFTRKYRGQHKTTKDGKEDVLKRTSAAFNWAYVGSDIDRRNTLLSCVYCSRAQLPQKMYFVGCEYDVLCQEANVMAKNLAGIYEEPDLGSRWSKNGIRWEMVPDQQHGFAEEEKSGQAEIERQRICHELYQRIDSWIREEVFQN